MSDEEKGSRKEYERSKKRLRRAGVAGSVAGAISAGIVPAVSNVRRAFVEGSSMDELPDDQVQLIEQMHRKHIGIGAGLIAMVEKFLMDEERMDAVIECMTIKDARDLLDLGVKLQRSAVAAMGNRNPGSNDEDNRKHLAQRVLKNLSLLDQLHALSVDDEVDPNDIVEGVFVNVNARDEVRAARDMIVRQPHQEGGARGMDDDDTDTNIPAAIRKPR